MAFTTDADTVIEKIVSAAYKLVDVERVSVFEVDHSKRDEEVMLKVCRDESIRGKRMSINVRPPNHPGGTACVVVILSPPLSTRNYLTACALVGLFLIRACGSVPV